MTDTLAIFGGTPVTRDSFPPWPQLSEKAISEAAAVLRSGRLTYWAGSRGRELERRFAEWASDGSSGGAPTYAVSVSSGSAGLHAALAAHGVKTGDEVILPSHTFIATAFAVIQAGAVPVFCDVARDHTLDPHAVEALLTPRTRAVIVVHLFGTVADMDPILRLARARNLSVIEDCAQCLGGEHKGRKAGTLGDVGVFSFSQTKHITTGGEGGMLVTQSEALARELYSVRDHGHDVSGWLPLPAGAEQPAAPHLRIGYNYRLTEAQSAIGLSELSRLDSWNLPRRRGYAKIYDHAFKELYGVAALPLSTEDRLSAYWQYPLELDLEKLTVDARAFQEALSAEGIPCSTYKWTEAYAEPALAGFIPPGQPPCAMAERLRARTIVLCLHPTLERSHIECVIAGVKKVLRAFKR